MPASDSTKAGVVEGLGERLDALIRAKGLRRDEFAGSSGVSRTTFYRALDGKASRFTITALAKALGVEESELLEGGAPPEVQGHEAYRRGVLEAVEAIKQALENVQRAALTGTPVTAEGMRKQGRQKKAK